MCVCECMRVEEGSVKKINVMLCYDSVSLKVPSVGFFILVQLLLL